MEALHHPGDIITNRYQVVTLLGRGGMGSTYAAIDLTNNQRVALKAVSLRQINDWKVLELFEREAKVLANLNHPFIPNYLDYFQLDTENGAQSDQVPAPLLDRRFYLAQELVEGESLAVLVERGWRTDEAEVKDIALQVLQILNYMHKLSPPIIHRDIKPQNIIRNSEGKVYLVDFGAVQDIYRNTLSLGGTVVGTFGYMPPEQFRGKTFFASDLYSLGTTLLFLLTHRSPADLPQKRMKIDFRSRLSLSEDFANWLDKMLEPTLEERYHSAEEALQVLQRKRQVNQPVPTTKPVQAIDSSNRLPKGSRIIFKQTDQRLMIKVPAPRWGGETIGIFFFATIWNFIVWTMTFGGVMGFLDHGITLWGFFFLLFFDGSALFFLGMFLWRIFGYVLIKIDPQTFQLTWQLLSFRERKYGKTADIQRVGIFTQTLNKGYQSVYCAIVHKQKQYKFGSALTPVEQDWLVAKISDYLKQVR